MTKLKKAEVHINTSDVEMTQIVLPSHTNNHGTAFGGQLAAWIDICAAVSAQRFSREAVVTVSMDEINFRKPVRRGMVVTLKSRVNQAWTTSIEVGVRVDAEDPKTGTIVHCCSAYLTFVAIDDDGNKCEVPELVVGSCPEAQERVQQAQDRRDNRLAMRQKRLQGRS
ncbi:MAG: acyl-CoA thioesterase [Myxococcota bacterium]